MIDQFETDIVYSDRPSKAAYVADKYREVLRGSILDVGADQQYLRPLLPTGTRYVGIGKGPGFELEVDLERGHLPFDDAEFQCVLCLDVLEHLENIHEIFDELVRVAAKWIIVSLPNPWSDALHAMRYSDYAPDKHLKFYGLDPAPPEDRHRWFFSAVEAEIFIRDVATRSGCRIEQLDFESRRPSSPTRDRAWWALARRLLRPDIEHLAGRGTLWALLDAT